MNPFDKVISALADRIVRQTSTGAMARCPAHDDRDPSLSITVGRDGAVVMKCHAGCDTTSVLAALGLEFRDLFPRAVDLEPRRSRTAPATWTAGDARTVWRLALGRVRDDAHIDADHDAYRYLASRGLAAAWEESGFGILHEDLEPHLPRAVRWWPREGYRVIVPLVDQAGDVVEVQARSIDADAKRKTLFPKGGSGRGRMFASTSAREMLVGCSDARVVLLGEGLTDFLALVIASPVPVVCAPGVGAARHVIGEWVRHRHVVIALDCDDAGERHVRDVADAVYDAGGEASRLEWPGDCVDACDVLRDRGDDGLATFLDERIEEAKAWTTAAAK